MPSVAFLGKFPQFVIKPNVIFCANPASGFGKGKKTVIPGTADLDHNPERG